MLWLTTLMLMRTGKDSDVSNGSSGDAELEGSGLTESAIIVIAVLSALILIILILVCGIVILMRAKSKDELKKVQASNNNSQLISGVDANVNGSSTNTVQLGALGRRNLVKDSEIAVIMNEKNNNMNAMNANRIRSISNNNDNEDLYEINYKRNEDIEGMMEKNGTIQLPEAPKVGETDKLEDELKYGSPGEDGVDNEMNENENVASSGTTKNPNIENVAINSASMELNEAEYENWSQRQVLIWLGKQFIKSRLNQDQIKAFLYEFNEMCINGQILSQLKKDTSLIDSVKGEFSRQNQRIGIWMVFERCVLSVGDDENAPAPAFQD